VTAGRRRLLCLLPFAPRRDATDGGGRAMAQLLLGLAEQQRVGLLYLRAPEQPAIDEALAARCEWVEEVPLHGPPPMALWEKKARVYASVLAGQPLWVGDQKETAYAARLQTLAHTWQPDIVQVEYHVMGQYLPALRHSRAPRILNQYEPGAQAARDKSRSPLRQGRWLPYFDALAWQRYERRLLSHVQAVVVFTERDQQAMARLAHRTLIVRIPIGEEIPAQPLDPLGSQPPAVLFVGNFKHAPNVDAALRLACGIWPQVLAQAPEAVLYLVGDQAPAEVQRLAGPNIVVTGRVPEVTPYLDRAAVVAAPLREGGGMRVKVMNALAAGKAIVASRLAIEGLGLADGQQVALAETDDEFSAAILRLLADPAERRAMAGRARAWACAHLGWQASLAAYAGLYTRLLAQAGP
jgi:glycosyltransferase involved in cell wall biosynthesis